MSIVRAVLERAIEERIQRRNVIYQDIEASLGRTTEYIELAKQNNQEINDLIDALEAENDHLERIAF